MESSNDCENNKCENNAECVDLHQNYTCDCLPGYTGPYCGQVIQVCLCCCVYFEGLYVYVFIIHCKSNHSSFAINVHTNIYASYNKLNRNKIILHISDVSRRLSMSPEQHRILLQQISCTILLCVQTWMGRSVKFEFICINVINMWQLRSRYLYQTRHISGVTCDVNIDDCVGHLCRNGGTCNDLVNGYNCTCGEYFFGSRLEHTFDLYFSPVLMLLMLIFITGFQQ